MMRKQMKKKMGITITVLAIAFSLSGCATTGDDKTLPQPIIQKAQFLRVGINPTAPPLISKQGIRTVGLEADLARALAQELGKTVRFIELGWNDLIPALLENRIDIIMSGMTITKAREVRIAFTEPYLRAGQMALVLRENYHRYPSLSSIKMSSSRVGMEKGTTGEFFVQQEFLLARKISFSTPEEGVQSLVEGRIDLFVHDAPVIWWMASEREAEGLIPLSFLLTQEKLAWGIRKEDRELLQSANLFLEAWNNDGRLHKATEHWIPLADD